MKDLKFRLLTKEEIEVRPAQIKDGRASLLLYIDSRGVVDMLNETVGAMNWQTEFYTAGNLIIGKLGIYNEERNEWIWKSDTGSESNIEAEKGLVSDIYKRLLSRWGVQELYTAPKITVPDDGYKCSGYKVSEIQYNDKRDITHLVIANRFGKEIYRWDKEGQTPQQNVQPISTVMTSKPSLEFTEGDKPTLSNRDILVEFCKKTKTEENKKELTSFYKFYDKKLSEGWRNTFNAENLWQRWMSKSFTANMEKN